MTINQVLFEFGFISYIHDNTSIFQCLQNETTFNNSIFFSHTHLIVVTAENKTKLSKLFFCHLSPDATVQHLGVHQFLDTVSCCEVTG